MHFHVLFVIVVFRSEESSAAREVTSGPEMHPVNNVPSGNGVDDDLSLGAEGVRFQLLLFL